MSVSVDDLVASLSSNHIGQEAIDLAALQAQLAQTLFSQSFSSPQTGPHHVSREPSYAQPCNTPTASSSFTWGQRVDSTRQRSLSMASTSSRQREDDGTWCDTDDMDEDERMVEDLLTPSSPIPTSASASHYPMSQSPLSPSAIHMGAMYTSPPESTSSSFTSTDPFYIAQMQAANAPNPQSFFTQSGRPSQHSPFLAGSQNASQQRREHHRYPVQTQRENHSLFVSTSAAYER